MGRYRGVGMPRPKKKQPAVIENLRAAAAEEHKGVLCCESVESNVEQTERRPSDPPRVQEGSDDGVATYKPQGVACKVDGLEGGACAHGGARCPRPRRTQNPEKTKKLARCTFARFSIAMPPQVILCSSSQWPHFMRAEESAL